MCTFTAKVKETGVTLSYDTENRTYEATATFTGGPVYSRKNVPAALFLAGVASRANKGMTVLMIQAHRCSKRGPNEFPCQLDA